MIWPELRNWFPLRSLKSWQRLVVSVAGGGALPEEAVYAIATLLFEAALVDEGIWTLVQYDVYGREQDIEMPRPADIVWDGRCVGLLLGISVRGEEGKTGSNQGVIVRRGVAGNMLLAAKEAYGDSEAPIFGKRQPEFLKKWHRRGPTD